MAAPDTVIDILREAKALAKRYRDATGKPLGITGEVAEYEAARILGVELAPARQAGYDAIEVRGNKMCRLQIKGRSVQKSYGAGQRMGSIDIEKEWDAVLLVLLDENYDAFEIYEADRGLIIAKIKKPGSRARNEKHALSVSQFKSIGRLRWSANAT